MIDMDKYFDEIAKQWDTEGRISRAKKIGQKISEYIPSMRYDNCMEYGCGTGLVGIELVNTLKHIDFTDTSENMVNIVKTKLLQCNIDNAKAFKFDIMKEFSKNVKYDLIFSSMVMHHVKDIETALKKFQKLLSPGGCLCIVDLNPEDGHFHDDHPGFDGHFGFDQDKLANTVRDAGFTNVKSETFLQDVKMIGDEPHPFSLFIMLGIAAL